MEGRPVVASAVGGIQDQIVDGEHGLLIDDPRDLEAYSATGRRLLRDEGEASALGQAGRERVREHFLSDHSLIAYLELIAPLVNAQAPAAGHA